MYEEELSFNGSNIDDIQEIIHDCWFDLDRILFNEEIRALTIFFQKPLTEERILVKNFFLIRKYAITVHEMELIINYVKDYEIIDTEKIGSYDFNVIKYDSVNNVLRILTGVPLKFTIFISKCDIKIFKTKKDAENIFKWSVF